MRFRPLYAWRAGPLWSRGHKACNWWGVADREIIARGGSYVNSCSVVGWLFLPAGRSGVRVGRTDSVPCFSRGVSLIWALFLQRRRSGQVDVRARLLSGGYGGRGRSPFRTLLAWRTSGLRQQSDDPGERSGTEVTEWSVESRGWRSAGVPIVGVVQPWRGLDLAFASPSVGVPVK